MGGVLSFGLPAREVPRQLGRRGEEIGQLRLDNAALSHRDVYNRLQHPVGPRLPVRLHGAIVSTGFLGRLVEFVRHVHNIGDVAQGQVERVGDMLQHVKFGGLLLPLQLGRDGDGDSSRRLTAD